MSNECSGCGGPLDKHSFQGNVIGNFCSRICYISIAKKFTCLHGKARSQCKDCQAMTWKEKIIAINLTMESHQCQDHGCIYGHSGGMGTNGGCASTKGSQMETRRELQSVVSAIREIIKRPESKDPTVASSPLHEPERFARFKVE